jgi:preprotein translocase subunit SecG
MTIYVGQLVPNIDILKHYGFGVCPTMNFLIGLLFVVVVICALLLIGIILIQQSKSGGGLAVLGGGATESVFGTAAGNVVTRTTVILAAIFIGCTFLLAILIAHRAEPDTLVDRYEKGSESPLEQAFGDALGIQKEDQPEATDPENVPAETDAEPADSSVPSE